MPVKTLNYQKGVVRNNCVDCLDRTNVVQSIIARTNLLAILYSNNIIEKPKSPFLSQFPGDLEQAFRDLWVDNGNRMSMLYAGTPALKTDFTKLGRRTFRGMINDVTNSTTRWPNIYLNILDWYIGVIESWCWSRYVWVCLCCVFVKLGFFFLKSIYRKSDLYHTTTWFAINQSSIGTSLNLWYWNRYDNIKWDLKIENKNCHRDTQQWLIIQILH